MNGALTKGVYLVVSKVIARNWQGKVKVKGVLVQQHKVQGFLMQVILLVSLKYAKYLK